MGLKVNTLELDVLEADPPTPPAGQVWWSDVGLGPKASPTAPGFMSLADKNILNNIAANGSGDDWISGLVVTSHVTNNQTVDYTAGSFMVNGVLYSVAAGGNYNLADGYGGVNHYTALTANQRAIVLIYVDTAQAIKSVSGTATSDPYPPTPAIPADVVCLAFVLISKKSNGTANNITTKDVTDCRVARRSVIDEAVKVNVNDLSSGFLRDKLTDNGNVQFVVENVDSVESLKADVKALGITDAHVAAANKDGVAGTVSMRTLGTGATSACAGNDSRLSDDRVASGLRSATTVVSVSAATAPIAGKVLTATDSTHATWQTPSGSADANAVHVNAASEISGITEKTIPVAADLLIIEDSAGGNVKKRVQVGNLPAAVLSSSEATATASATTTSASYVLMTGMSLTPGAGTYLCLFSTSLSNSNSGAPTFICLYANGVQVASTESQVSYFKADDIGDTAVNKVVTVAAGQAIELKWKVSAGTGTARARVMTLVKIG